MAYSRKLKTYRLMAGITQEEMAAAGGIYVQTIINIENELVGINIQTFRRLRQIIDDAKALKDKAA